MPKNQSFLNLSNYFTKVKGALGGKNDNTDYKEIVNKPLEGFGGSAAFGGNAGFGAGSRFVIPTNSDDALENVQGFADAKEKEININQDEFTTWTKIVEEGDRLEISSRLQNGVAAKAKKWLEGKLGDQLKGEVGREIERFVVESWKGKSVDMTAVAVKLAKKGLQTNGLDGAIPYDFIDNGAYDKLEATVNLLASLKRWTQEEWNLFHKPRQDENLDYNSYQTGNAREVVPEQMSVLPFENNLTATFWRLHEKYKRKPDIFKRWQSQLIDRYLDILIRRTYLLKLKAELDKNKAKSCAAIDFYQMDLAKIVDNVTAFTNTTVEAMMLDFEIGSRDAEMDEKDRIKKARAFMAFLNTRCDFRRKEREFQRAEIELQAATNAIDGMKSSGADASEKDKAIKLNFELRNMSYVKAKQELAGVRVDLPEVPLLS